MLLKIDESIFNNHRDYKLGVLIIKDFDNSKRVSSVEALLRGTVVQRKNELKNQDISELEIVKNWDRTLGNFGINPDKNLPFIKSMFTKLKGCYVTNFNKRELIDSINKALSYNKRTNGRDIIKDLGLDGKSIAKKINIMYQTI